MTGKVDILSNKVVEAITKLVLPILERKNFELVNVNYEKEKTQWFLRVFIDKKGGIDIEDTTFVSEELSQKMDEEGVDFFEGVDFLEVSSPGIERLLKKESDFAGALGKFVRVSLYQAVNQKKNYEGELLSATLEELTLRIQEKTMIKNVVFERKNIAKACLAIKI